MKTVLVEPRITEMRRLRQGLSTGERPLGVGIVRIRISCPFGASLVVQKIKDVILGFDEHACEPSVAFHWQKVLPSWFVSECVADMTEAESQRWLEWWRALPPAKQIAAEEQKAWSLQEWLYWMGDANRQWFWWDAVESEDGEVAVLSLDVVSWPFAWGALRWLAKTAGAMQIVEDNKPTLA